MKKKLVILFLFTYVTFTACASEGISTHDEEKISSFVEMYNENNLNVVSVDIVGKSTEGGDLTALLDDKDRIISLDVYLYFEMGKVNYKFYLVEHELIKVIKTTVNYNIPIILDGLETETTEITHMIIKEGICYIFNEIYNGYQVMDDTKIIDDYKEYSDLIFKSEAIGNP